MTTISEALEKFIDDRIMAGLSVKTVADYRLFCSPFIDRIGSNRDVLDVSQDMIDSYRKELLSRPISKATVATYTRTLKVFLKWMSDNYPVRYQYSKIKVPKSPKKDVLIYSDIQVKQIFGAIHTDTEWLTLRNQCIIALMYDSGLRQSEVCTLKRAQVSFTENRMTVTGKGDKERTVPLGSFSKRFMQEYLKACPYRSEMVFLTRRGEPLSCNAVKLMVSKLAKKLPFMLSSHKLRHNFATNYCLDQYEQRGAVDIYALMYLMGHEELETTRRYLHMANQIIASRNCISHLDNIMEAL